MKKWIFLAVTLFLMVLIFCLSAQEGEQSYALSQEVAQQMQENTATQTVVPAWFSENFHANVRKWAHVYLYALLGISAALTVSGFAGLRWQKRAGTTALCCGGIAAAICFAYAAGDELHAWSRMYLWIPLAFYRELQWSAGFGIGISGKDTTKML